MNEEQNHEQARLALQTRRLEEELRVRDAELARTREELQKGRTVSLVSTLLLAAVLGLLGTTLGVLVLGRLYKANKAPQSVSSAQLLTFEPSAFTDPHLLAETQHLADYLRQHGASAVNRPLHVKIVTNMPPGFEDYISHYDAGMTYILPTYFRDADVLFKEYVHLLLLSDETHIRLSADNTDVFDIEDGLTTYFPCSFNNHARWGEASARNTSLDFDADNLENTLTFADHVKNRSLLWGGTFWELRQRLGRDTADTLLLSAWQSLQPSDMSSDTDKAFANLLLQQDQRLQGGKHVAVIEAVFQKRKLEL